MKFFNTTFLLVALALTCCLTLAHAQEEASNGTGPKRPALRRPGGKSAKTTTPAPAPKDEEADYGDENPDAQYGDEGDEDGNASSTTTTSTEPPKKIGPVIRPFRSNDDFLNSLKRRQQDAKKHRSAEKPTPKSRPAAVEDGDEGAESAPAPAPAKAGFKAGNTALSRRKLSKPGKPESAADDAAAEETEEEPKEDSKAKRLPQTRLALRKRN